MRELVELRARADAGCRHPGPAEPLGLVARAGRGRRERPRRALRERRPHLAGAPVPLAPSGPPPARADGIAVGERLCVYPRYIDQEWVAQGVLDMIAARYWSFIPRRGSGRRAERVIRRDLVAGAIERGSVGRRVERGGADRAVRRDAAGGDRGDPRGGGRAARGARRGHGHVRRSAATSTCRTSASWAARSAGSGRGGAHPTPTSTTATRSRRRVKPFVSRSQIHASHNLTEPAASYVTPKAPKSTIVNLGTPSRAPKFEILPKPVEVVVKLSEKSFIN